jgi:UDP-2,3-diacylglucosamine hydrolase
MHHTLFISDLHLDASRPDITQAFFTFLAQEAPQADALYILGDLFESWIGDDNATVFNQSIVSALKQLTSKGIPVFLMHGNRDFLLGSIFCQASGCQLIADPTTINLYGKTVLLTHGDMLCTLDHKHQQFRSFIQNPKNLYYLLKLPLWARNCIAKFLRSRSKHRTRLTEVTIMDVTPEAVEKLMEKEQVSLLIHGHTHRPAIHDLTIHNQPAHRIVLGDWYRQANGLRYEASGDYTLVRF